MESSGGGDDDIRLKVVGSVYASHPEVSKLHMLVDGVISSYDKFSLMLLHGNYMTSFGVILLIALIVSSWPRTSLPRNLTAIKRFEKLQALTRAIRNVRAEYSLSLQNEYLHLSLLIQDSSRNNPR
ncbi:hypothetical protein Hanom_Chr13g01207771 [Helianthus anomalus]